MNKPSFFAHPQAMVESENIGPETRIWEFAHVMRGVTIGSQCNIGAGCFVETGAVIGDHVVVKNGVSVWNGVTIEDDVFVGPGVVLTNEHEPRSGFPKDLALTVIRKGASIGAGAILVAPLVIGEYATVGAGAVVIRNVAPHSLVVGNPARAVGHMCICGRKLRPVSQDPVKGHCTCGLRYALTEGKLHFTPAASSPLEPG
jgi:UDP-2-acetamido-3-amino-2,3-dideoxy-glucuronate N-acetyltransferase